MAKRRGSSRSRPVKVQAQGQTRLTASLPTDGAFQQLAKGATKAKKAPTEKEAFTAIASLGINTVETCCSTTSSQASGSRRAGLWPQDNAKLKTALGPTIKVDVKRARHKADRVWLKDKDTNDRNPRVIAFTINAGNRQITHGIDRVLRSVNVP